MRNSWYRFTRTAYQTQDPESSEQKDAEENVEKWRNIENRCISAYIKLVYKCIHILIKKKYTLNNLWKKEICCGKYLTHGATVQRHQTAARRYNPTAPYSNKEHNTVQIRWASEQIVEPTADFVLAAVKR